MLEPRPLFDPFALQTTARADGGGFVLDGVKALVPARAQRRAVPRRRRSSRAAARRCSSSSPAPTASSVEAEPAMGMRAAATATLTLESVDACPACALLGDGDPAVYAEAVQRARLAWCALVGRHGAGGARLRHPLRQRARRVRRADQPPPGRRVRGLGHRDRARGHAPGHLARRRPRRPGQAVRATRPRSRAGCAPTRAPRSAPRASSCSAATATSRSTRSSAGTATCAPPA